ncbi:MULTISPECIES: hypothetical protein [Paenarthrobacter]|jgi:hypothetical protein|uniref:hypothetical protein n=1 Tax=Paenarthrobacter TaxID=1742992 RepID=UPI0022310BDF|nr:hypothetical protein [Paenarthrobacter sp. PAE-2]MCW3767339.1 hypothetical protein [Paenarthrobacter sp. PAE-2]
MDLFRDSHPDLSPFRVERDGTCWWCGAVADSREHKYKRTDLARLQGDGPNLVWGGDEGRLHNIQSIRKSPAVRFEMDLCRRCNDTRSQPFDRAYDTYSAYIWENADSLWGAPGLDMKAIFGIDWERKQLDLGRYFAKHFASRMVLDGLPVPAGLLEFLNGAVTAKNVRFCFTIDEGLWLLRKYGASQGSPIHGLWLRPTFAWVSSDGRELRAYETQSYLGYVGVSLLWSAEQEHMDSFFPHVRPVLNVVKATEEMMKIIGELERK